MNTRTNTLFATTLIALTLSVGAPSAAAAADPCETDVSLVALPALTQSLRASGETDDEIPCIPDVCKLIQADGAEATDGERADTDPCFPTGPGGLSNINAGLVWTNACEGTLSEEVEYTKVEGALIDTPIIDFVKITYEHFEQKIGYKYSCNVDVTAKATGWGGASRNVLLFVDGVVADSCAYTGVSPNTLCDAVSTHAAAGPSGSGTANPGDDVPSSVEVCFQLDVSGENHQAPIGIDVISDVADDYCADLGISYQWVKADAATDLVEALLG